MTPHAVRAAQLVYTRVEPEFSPIAKGGFQTVYWSAQLTPGQIAQIERRVQCFQPFTVDTRRLQCFFLDDGLIVLSQSRIVSRWPDFQQVVDRRGRAGAFVAHCLVLPPEALRALGGDPLTLLESRFFTPDLPSFLMRYGNAADFEQIHGCPRGIIPPLEIRAPLEPRAPLPGWEGDEAQRLTLLSHHAETLRRDARSLALIGEQHQIVAALQTALEPLSFEQRLGCSFDTCVDRCMVAAGLYWAVGLRERADGAGFIEVDAARQRVITPFDLPPPEAALPPTLPALLDAPGATEILTIEPEQPAPPALLITSPAAPPPTARIVARSATPPAADGLSEQPAAPPAERSLARRESPAPADLQSEHAAAPPYPAALVVAQPFAPDPVAPQRGRDAAPQPAEILVEAAEVPQPAPAAPPQPRPARPIAPPEDVIEVRPEHAHVVALIGRAMNKSLPLPREAQKDEAGCREFLRVYQGRVNAVLAETLIAAVGSRRLADLVRGMVDERLTGPIPVLEAACRRSLNDIGLSALVFEALLRERPDLQEEEWRRVQELAQREQHHGLLFLSAASERADAKRAADALQHIPAPIYRRLLERYGASLPPALFVGGPHTAELAAHLQTTRRQLSAGEAYDLFEAILRSGTVAPLDALAIYIPALDAGDRQRVQKLFATYMPPPAFRRAIDEAVAAERPQGVFGRIFRRT